MTDNEAVLRERRGRVLLITINRPDQRNAVNAAVARGIADALDELDGDAALSVGVLTGAGKGFSAGMDLKAFVAGESPHVEGRGFGGITQRASAKPLIAAVEGFAVAGGLELALSCDLIVAARGRGWGSPRSSARWWRPAGALLRLPRALPRPIAMELALTGDPISAERAYELGLINRLTEPGETVQTALELADGDRRQRSAGAGRQQADPGRVRRLARVRVLRAPARDRRSGDGLGGRTRGCDRVRGKRDPVWKGR